MISRIDCKAIIGLGFIIQKFLELIEIRTLATVLICDPLAFLSTQFDDLDPHAFIKSLQEPDNTVCSIHNTIRNQDIRDRSKLEDKCTEGKIPRPTNKCIQCGEGILRVIILPVELLHLDLELIPIAGFIPTEQCDDILDLCIAVMWETCGVLVSLNAIQLTLSVEALKVIGNVLAIEYIKGSRLARARHESRHRNNRRFWSNRGSYRGKDLGQYFGLLNRSSESTQVIRITRCRIVEIGVIGYGIAEFGVAGVSDISGVAAMVVIPVVVVVAGLTGTATTSNIACRYTGIASGRVSGRAVVIRKAGVFAVCAAAVAVSASVAVSSIFGEVGAIHYMGTVSRGHPHITRANRRTSTGSPWPRPMAGIEKVNFGRMTIMTSVPLRIRMGLAAVPVKETVQPIECKVAKEA